MAMLRQARGLSRTCVAAMRSLRITSLHHVHPVQLLHNWTIASSSFVVCPPTTTVVYETLGAVVPLYSFVFSIIVRRLYSIM
jgi:hypothetical protein